MTALVFLVKFKMLLPLWLYKPTLSRCPSKPPKSVSFSI